jgi:hypothetical protein
MKVLRVILAAALLAFAPAPLRAQDESAMAEKIKKLEEQLAAQQALLEEIKKALEEQKAQSAQNTAEIQKAMEDQKAATTDEIKKTALETSQKEVAKETQNRGLTGWKFGGDIRLRYEGTYYDVDSSFEDRNRERIRLRFKVSKNIGWGVTGVFQLASGMGFEPTSTNQTLTDSFDRKDVWIDQAYITWTPDVAGHFFTFGGGKMANPFVATPMVWDTDVNPEGFFEKFSSKWGAVEPYFTFAQLTVRENSSKKDSYGLVYQGGANLKLAEKLTASANLAYYDYVHYDTNYKYPNGNTVGGSGTNTWLDARDFHILDLLAQLKYDGWRHPLDFFVDYARNVDAAGPYGDEDTAWSVGGGIGRNKAQKDWSVTYRYARIEPNAVVGAWADSDFGFANRKGSEVKFKYNIYDPLTIGASFWSTRPVVELVRDPWDRLQIDLEYKF